MVGHHLRIDSQAKSPIPLDDDTVGRDLAYETTIAGTQPGRRIVSIEHDPRAHAYARPEPSCKVTCASGIHADTVGRGCSAHNPRKREEPPGNCRIARGVGGQAPNSTAEEHGRRRTSPFLEAAHVADDPRGDREWEHWPGRGAAEDGIRHRLKALFSASDDEDAIEALIVERGREIEQRTEQLQTTISDLERREEQTGQLRSAVEEMLRHGSAELDERHGELAALALELRARDKEVRTGERDLAVRKQELGAVELRRAAVERKEEAATDREGALEQIAAGLARRELRLEEAEEAEVAARREELPGAVVKVSSRLRISAGDDAAGPDVAGHILYVPGDGYRIVARNGRVARVDAHVELEGQAFVVTRVGRSPLPGDGRLCAYLESVGLLRHN